MLSFGMERTLSIRTEPICLSLTAARRFFPAHTSSVPTFALFAGKFDSMTDKKDELSTARLFYRSILTANLFFEIFSRVSIEDDKSDDYARQAIVVKGVWIDAIQSINKCIQTLFGLILKLFCSQLEFTGVLKENKRLGWDLPNQGSRFGKRPEKWENH